MTKEKELSVEEKFELIKRNTEDEIDLQKRIDRAKMELEHKDKFDHFIQNIELEKAILETEKLIRKIISKEKN